MSEDRVEALYPAIDAGDLETLQTLITPDGVFHVAGDSPIGRVRRGLDVGREKTKGHAAGR